MDSYLNRLQKNWEELAKDDPLWAILTSPEKKGRKWSPEDFFETGKTEIEKLICVLQETKINYSNQKALDFGCGIGRLTQPLGEYFNKVIGVDISNKMIEYAQRYNYKDNCTFLTNENFDLKTFEANSFDFIYTNIVLQHIYPKFVFTYLMEFIRVLKQDGLLIFQLPDRTINPFINFVRNNLLSQKYFYKLYLVIKYGFNPVIETYCIRKNKIIEFLNSNGGFVFRVEENRNAGPKWISYTYYVRKLS